MNVEAETVLFEVFFREGRGSRWRRIGTAGTRAEALDLCKGRGDFRLAERRADSRPACAGATNGTPNGQSPT